MRTDSTFALYPQTYYSCVQPTQCVFGDATSPRTVVLLGDSHAAMWLPALIPMMTAARDRLVLLWYQFCPTGNLSIWNPLTHGANAKCSEFRMNAISMVKRITPSLVLLADRTSNVRNQLDEPISGATWKNGEIKTIEMLKATDTKVAIIGDISILAKAIPDCLAAHPTQVQKCSVSSPYPKLDQHFSAERAAAKAQSSAIHRSPTMALRCSLLASDRQHGCVLGLLACFGDLFGVPLQGDSKSAKGPALRVRRRVGRTFNVAPARVCQDRRCWRRAVKDHLYPLATCPLNRQSLSTRTLCTPQSISVSPRSWSWDLGIEPPRPCSRIRYPESMLLGFSEPVL